MTTLMQIEQSLRRMERSRHPHADDLFDLSTVAEELGFKPAALADILATGLGPEPRPVLYAGCYLFERWQVSSLWVWLIARASDQECGEVSGHMLRHDPALELVTPGDDAREFVLWAMWEERGGRCYSDRFHLVLDA
jgi:hypothetical protein